MLSLLLLLPLAVHAQYTATYTYDPSNPNSLPDTTEDGQIGTNQCGTGSNQTSLCQNVFINSIDDFCLWAPPNVNGGQTIGQTEEEEVAYCLKSGYGTRLFPDGTILGAHFVQTPDYVQVTGWGNFTLIGISGDDLGGELDPHGYTGNGNPVGGLVFGNSFESDGSYIQYHEWTNFMSANEFCIRACKPGPNAAVLCEHIYDTIGCEWNMPANYDPGYFESCLGDSAEAMGVYGTSTWFQSVSPTPSAHDIPSSSSCYRVESLSSYAPYPTTELISTTYSDAVISTGAAASTVTYVLSAPSGLFDVAAPSSSSSIAPKVTGAGSSSHTTSASASATHSKSAGAQSFGSPITALAMTLGFLVGGVIIL